MSQPNVPADEPARGARVRQAELLISTVLRSGVVLSISLLLIGTLVSFLHHPGYRTSADELRRLTRPGAAFPHTMTEVLEALRDRRGQAIVVAGLLVLIATPVVRVAISILVFIHEGDRRFAVITCIVLLLLLASFVLGRAGG